MVGREGVRVLVEQLVRFRVKVDCVRVERTRVWGCRVARLRIMAWVHLNQGIKGGGERDSHADRI